MEKGKKASLRVGRDRASHGASPSQYILRELIVRARDTARSRGCNAHGNIQRGGSEDITKFVNSAERVV